MTTANSQQKKPVMSTSADLTGEHTAKDRIYEAMYPKDIFPALGEAHKSGQRGNLGTLKTKISSNLDTMDAGPEDVGMLAFLIENKQKKGGEFAFQVDVSTNFSGCHYIQEFDLKDFKIPKSVNVYLWNNENDKTGRTFHETREQKDQKQLKYMKEQAEALSKLGIKVNLIDDALPVPVKMGGARYSELEAKKMQSER